MHVVSSIRTVDAAPGLARPELAPPTPGAGRIKWALLAILALVLITTAFFADSRVGEFALRHSSPLLTKTASAVSHFGEWYWLLLTAGTLLLLGLVCRHRTLTRFALALALSCCIAGVASTTIRSVAGRTRPSATVAQGWYGLRYDSQWLVGNHEFNSFPSGHTGAAVGFAVPLIIGTRRWRIPAILLAASIGWSRVYLGCHHFSDVIVAALIGTAAGIYTWHRLVPRLLGRWAGSPSSDGDHRSDG